MAPHLPEAGARLLWAPWRVAYVTGKKVRGCILCIKIKGKKDKEDYILYRGPHSFVILNTYPYNSGHLMVSPTRHLKDFETLTRDEKGDLLESLTLSITAVKKALHPDGMNIGMNLGRAAGAGVAGHIHIHVVPRWNGDTNFMPLLAETKVMPEHLMSTYERLRRHFGHA